MDPSLARELTAILGESAQGNKLVCEGPLRVAARTLGHLPAHETSATTVVGVLGVDDLDTFRLLVHDIAQEYGLETTVKIRAGSFSVRFCRPAVRAR